MKDKLKPLTVLIFFATLSNQVYSLTTKDSIAHPPIRFKPDTPHLFSSGFSPRQVRRAYGFNQVDAQGRGQIIAIVDAFDHPRIEADLAVFNKEYGLPSCTTSNGCFKKIYANGTQPTVDAIWAAEIALDVEWAYALAPSAQIILVEAASSGLPDLFQAVEVAVQNGATVVSMSWGAGEFPEEILIDPIFNNPAVTFIASSGDNGYGTLYPAASPYVLSVGGTSLYTDFVGNYFFELAWAGSGGGQSIYEDIPDYQRNFPILFANNKRGIPDVAYNGDPDTGVSVYNSVPNEYGTGWQIVGGTSAGAPQWAAIVAVTNDALKTNTGGSWNTLLYSAGQSKDGYPSTSFNDITFGHNGDCGTLCTAQAGYDYLTGLGTPKVGHLIDELSQMQAVNFDKRPKFH